MNDGARASCRLESDKAPIQDGYQTSSVQVLVTAQAVQVVSDSTLDGGSGDIGLQVDQQEFVKADRLGGEKVVIFASGAPVLISDFKAGLKLRLQLRFWPTWPETGNHSAVVSLIGFTKAWDEMHQTCH